MNVDMLLTKNTHKKKKKTLMYYFVADFPGYFISALDVVSLFVVFYHIFSCLKIKGTKKSKHLYLESYFTISSYKMKT